ncbi:spermatogenesis-associated protein 4-like isoform X2 [Convolutriloba macropyga]
MISYSARDLLALSYHRKKDKRRGESDNRKGGFSKSGTKDDDTCLYACVIYLSPKDCHRFYSPVKWTINYVRHFSGSLLSVRPGVLKFFSRAAAITNSKKNNHHSIPHNEGPDQSTQGTRDSSLPSSPIDGGSDDLSSVLSVQERCVMMGEWEHGFFSFTAVGATAVGSITINSCPEMQTNNRTRNCLYQDFKLRMLLLPRDVFKWLQSMDLTVLVRNVRRDCSNGYVVAEILHCYFPQHLSMHQFHNGHSLESKLKNWTVLRRLIEKLELDIPDELVEGTIHMKPDAAELLIQIVYNRVTNRVIKSVPVDHEIDFSDWYYQRTLPLHARSTAAKAVSNNIKHTELVTEPNHILKQHKAQTIVNKHMEQRLKQRAEFPTRFDIDTSLGEACVRRPPVPTATNSKQQQQQQQQQQSQFQQQNSQ